MTFSVYFSFHNIILHKKCDLKLVINDETTLCVSIHVCRTLQNTLVKDDILNVPKSQTLVYCYENNLYSILQWSYSNKVFKYTSSMPFFFEQINMSIV